MCVYACAASERGVACALDEDVCPTDNPSPPIALRSGPPSRLVARGGETEGGGAQADGGVSQAGGTEGNSAYSLPIDTYGGM